MLKFVGSSNLFKYFGQQSRGFTTSFVKLCRYNENYSSSNYERFSSNMFTNETKFPTVTKSIKDNLVRQNLPLGANDSVIIKLKQGRTRKNFIEVTKSFRGQNTGWKYMDLPTLDVPEEAYNFVRALDEIIIACDGKKFCEYSNPNEELISLKLFTKFYDIFLNLLRDQEGRIFLEVLQKMENSGMYRQFYIKIDALPWIRKTIAEILREYDDSEKLLPMPIVDFPFSYKRLEKKNKF
uniref:Uncharacterized protein n=1 Tax=Meloidogyne enterolobii TaxID=390850 RepID=A0A6V7VTQ0_MELEN|nr:unnamed protein product [Meloidogyne enterolobii]